VNLYVGDLAASAAFYRDVCGLAAVFAEPGIGAVFLSNGNSHHDVAVMQASTAELVGRDGRVQVESTRGTKPGLNHLGWEMTNERDLVDAITAAPQHGVTVQRTLDHLISRSAYLSDPDGSWLEFYADSTPDWRGVYATMADQLISAQWQPDAVAASEESHFVNDAPVEPLEGAAMETLRTARAALIVSDLDQSVHYYTEQLGLGLRQRSTSRGFAVVGGTLGLGDLLLLEARNGKAVGLHHFSLDVADEAALDRGAQRLTASGVPILAEMTSASGRGLVVEDPDGQRVAFFAPESAVRWDVEPVDDVQRDYLL
jgi:catechol 2,3-dioxygenase